MNVSIIIPVYNASHFIVDCLNSVANQTIKENIECILVDDCSHDKSIQLIENYIFEYNGNVSFLLLKQDRNQGPSTARNRGIREAKGDYIYFLDADDIISTDCIELLYTLAKKYQLDYVQGMYHRDENYHMPVYESQDCNHPYTEKKAIKKMMLDYAYIPYTPHNRLIKRDLLIDNKLFFPENIKVREDFYWMFFMAKYVNRMALCDKVTYYRGYNGDSLTHNKNKDREIFAYRTVIERFCANIDPFMEGEQKSLILDVLIMAIKGKYYVDDQERKFLIDIFLKENKFIERCLLKIFFMIDEGFVKACVLRLLLRIYRRN